MQKESGLRLWNRRSMLTLAGATFISWENLFAKEFWDKKDPSQWTGQEIDQLTTKSPWAKQVTPTMVPDSTRGSYGGPMGGPPVGVGGMGYPRGRMGGGRRGGYPRPTSGQTNYKGTVRWESAQPILDALKNPLPDAFANHYVIAIRDIPLIDNSRRSSQDSSNSSDTPKPSTPDQPSKQVLDNLKMYTSLEPKGRALAQPGVVQQMTPGGTYFLFGFSKELLDFGKKDEEVIFQTRLGRLQVKTKFNPSLMMYKGKLAV